MKVDDRCVLWVRTLIDGRIAEGERLAEELAADGADDALVPLLYYSFVFAIRKAFEGADPDNAVARARARATEKGVVLDPAAAESEVRHALGDSGAGRSPDADARALVHVALLKFAVTDADLDKAQIDDVLARARQSVEQGIGRQRRSDHAGH